MLKIIKPYWLTSLKDKISQILNWFRKNSLSLESPLCLLLNKNDSQENKISKFSKSLKSSNLGFFLFLLVPNICDSQAFHFLDCLWRLNLKMLKVKKQIWLHFFNDFKFFLANEIELTIEHYDWSKWLFKGSPFVHLKKIKFQKKFILH